MAKDLAAYIAKVKEELPGDVVHIGRSINPQKHEVTALLQHLENANRYPMVIFDNVQNLLEQRADYALLYNMFATRERFALALDMPASQSKLPLTLEFARREKQKIAPVVIPADEAPVREVVEMGEQADLRRLPIPIHHEMDLGYYITMAIILKDPDDGFYEMSFCKSLYQEPRLAVTCIATPHIYRMMQKYEARGQRMPIVHIMAHHPAFFLGSLALTPWGNNDYETIGAFLGEPVRLTPSSTWGSDFLIPADAELVIEGEVPPGVREVINPFGEYARDYQPQMPKPVTEVTAISHRRKPIMQGIFAGHQELWNLGSMPSEGSIFNDIMAHFPEVTGVHLPNSGTAMSCYVSIKKSREGVAKLVGMQALLGGVGVQWVIVVDDNIDVYNERDVLWAVISYVNPKRDITIIDNAGLFLSYVTGACKVIIDATKPLDMPMPSMIKVPDEAMAKIKLDEWLEGQ